MSEDRELDFSIVIPAYNEDGAIGSVLSRLIGELNAMERPYEILVVSDGSTDETAAEVAQVGAPVRLVEHPYNMGNGAAIKTGIRQAHGKVLVCMDADGQHSPEDIARFIGECERFDMVVGARSSASQAGWHRSLANRIYNAFASYVTGRSEGGGAVPL